MHEFIRVAGTWMIGQVTERVSRSIFYKGVMKSKPVLLFLSLRYSTLKRSDPSISWIEQWCYILERSINIIDPEGWFFRRHDHNVTEEGID